MLAPPHGLGLTAALDVSQANPDPKAVVVHQPLFRSGCVSAQAHHRFWCTAQG